MELLGWSDLEKRSVPDTQARDLIESFESKDQDVMKNRDKTLEFLRLDPNPFARSNSVGHICASSLVVDPDSKQSLLIFHRYFRRWQQTGGHTDGDHDVVRVGLREAIEETGLPDLQILPKVIDVGFGRGEGDIDHMHYDIRFLVVSHGSPSEVVSPEGLELRWFPLNYEGDELDVARRRMLAVASEVVSEVPPSA